MAFDAKGLDEYVDVAQRIADFRERYPDGSLEPLDLKAPYEIRKVDGTDKHGKDFTATFVIYVAAAYRDRADTRPGVGMAWEVFPGRTPYTLGSELMNAETSAQGRAIVAALASDSKRGVASREEVRNRQAEREDDHAPANGHRPQARDHSGETPWDAEVRHEERPGSADPADLRAIHATYYSKLGFDERTDALKILHTSEQLVGHALNGPNKGKSHKNLTWHEAKKLRAELEGFKGDRGALLARLSGVTQAAAQDAAEGSQETLP